MLIFELEPPEEPPELVIAIFPLPKRDCPLIVLIFVPLTNLSCFFERFVFTSVLVAKLLVSIEPPEEPVSPYTPIIQGSVSIVVPLVRVIF